MGDDERRGDWMTVYSGGRFWPLDPRPEDVKIEDIAHALSLICRYNGHTRRFYSVAEHCVLMAEVAERQGLGVTQTLLALLHDAAEAYLCDLVRPVKPQVIGYEAAEKRVERAIAIAMGLWNGDTWSLDKTPEIDDLDSAILYDEAKELLPLTGAGAWYEDYAPGLEVTIIGLPPVVAEAEFLSLYHRFIRLKEIRMVQPAAKFRKKPVIIDAMPFDGTTDSAMEIRKWVAANGGMTSSGGLSNGALLIDTLEGEMTVTEGDWVIRGVKGEFYPCKPDIFKMTYEPVEE